MIRKIVTVLILVPLALAIVFGADRRRIVAAGAALLAPSVTRRLIAEFAQLPAPSAPSPALDELTEREIETLGFLARGLTNAEIAARLFVGEATVKTHMTHILGKLRLHDRVQAVVLAYECGLVQPGVE